MNKVEIKSLNALRLVFCFWVVIIHYYNLYFFQNYFTEGILKEIFDEFIMLGFFPVSFFFTISGFFISYNYREKSKQLNLYTFIRNRIKKLYPLVFFSIVVEVILIFAYAVFDIPHFKPFSLFSFIASLLLIRNGWFHEVGYNAYGSGTWFINVLLLCYIVWFLASKKLDNKKYVLFCFGMTGIGYFLFPKHIGFPFLYNNSCRGYLSFFIGCLLYELYNRLSEKQGVWLARVLLVVNILIGYLWFERREYIRNIYMLFSLVVVPAVIFIGIYMKPIVKILNSKICGRASKYTMSIYLTHTLVFEIIIVLDKVCNWNIDFSKIHIVLILFLAAVFVAIFMNRHVEKRLAVYFEKILLKFEKYLSHWINLG